MDLEALKEKRAELAAKMKAIMAVADESELTDEQAEAFDKLEAEFQALDEKIVRAEKMGKVQSRLADVRPAAAADHLSPGRIAPEARREFESFGEYMYAVRFRPSDQRLHYHEPEMRGEQRMDDGPSGGFMVPPQFLAGMRQVDPQEAIFRPRAEVMGAGDPPDAPVSMPALDQTGASPANVYGGVTVSWIGEGDAKPQTDAKLREITWTPHEVAGHITVTDKLLRNWSASGPFLERQLRGALLAAEDSAFLRGNGVGKPSGVIDSGAAYAVNRSTANEVAKADLDAMISRLMGNGVWIASRAIMPQLLALQDNSGSEEGLGGYIWQPNAREGEPDRLYGRPILWNQRSPGLGTKGDLVLADLGRYVIKDGSGPFIAASPHVHFVNNKTVIKIFSNVDGKPWLSAPFQGEDGYQTSPFVVLDVPA